MLAQTNQRRPDFPLADRRRSWCHNLPSPLGLCGQIRGQYLDDNVELAASRARDDLFGTNPKHSSDYNQRVTLQAIRRHGELTRADLTRLTGLTAPTILKMTNRLEEAKIIVETGRTSGGYGKPAAKLAINPGGAYSIGLNIDRDHLTLVIVNLGGQVVSRASIDVSFAPPERVLSFVAEQIEANFNAGALPVNRLIGLGVAIPDDLGLEKTRYHNQPEDYARWSTVQIGDLLSSVYNLPVIVENDAAAAAIGELHFGTGPRFRNFIYVLICAGLGGSIVINGECYRGTNGRSGEIGFVPQYDPLHPDAADPAKSIGEAAVFAELVASLQPRGINLRQVRGFDGLDNFTRTQVQEWLNRVADLLYLPLVSLACGLDPEMIYFGGRVPDFMIDDLTDRLSGRVESLKARLPVVPRFSRATLSEDASAIGAAVLPIHDQLLPSKDTLLKAMNL